MKRLTSLVLAVMIAFGVSVSAKKEKEPEGIVPEYQIEGAGGGTGSTSMVKVSVLAKKKEDVTDAVLGKCAVHGILFRGYTDTTNQGFGSASNINAMAGSPAAEKQFIDFYEPFFQDGTANGYVQIVDDSRRVIKSGKLYKVTAIVAVSSGQLRRDLVKQGKIKDLNSGW